MSPKESVTTTLQAELRDTFFSTCTRWKPRRVALRKVSVCLSLKTSTINVPFLKRVAFLNFSVMLSRVFWI
jgi:hypothetical protein